MREGMARRRVGGEAREEERECIKSIYISFTDALRIG
jgi:hypothetical protein